MFLLVKYCKMFSPKQDKYCTALADKFNEICKCKMAPVKFMS